MITIQQREAVVAEAKTWIHTPYRGWSHVKGAGVDCGQLLYIVFHNVGLIPEIVDLPKDYPLYIGLHQASTEYVDLVLTHFREITENELLPGDVVVWKLTESTSFCHGAIVTEWPEFIHAYGDQVKQGDAKKRLRFSKAEKMFFTLKDLA